MNNTPVTTTGNAPTNAATRSTSQPKSALVVAPGCENCAALAASNSELYEAARMVVDWLGDKPTAFIASKGWSDQIYSKIQQAIAKADGQKDWDVR